MSKVIIIGPGQTLFDIALTYLGSINSVMDIVNLNGFDSINQNIYPGDELLIPSTPDNSQLVNYYFERDIQVSSGIYPIAADFNIDFNDDFLT